MIERLRRFINKHLRMIVVFVIIIAVAMGMLLMVISGNDEGRDNVPVDPTASQEEEKPKKERKLAQSVDHPGVSDVALNLYNARVDDISDTAQIAQLVEASDMREDMGSYLVTLQQDDGKQALVITFDKELHAGEDTAFDELAGWYAEQFLCLVEEADQVIWKYKIEKSATEIADEKAKLEAEAEKAKKEKEAKEDSDKKKEDDSKDKSDKEKTEEIKVAKYKTVEKSMTVEEATEILGTAVKGYSESPELVQTLLNNQKGIV